MSVFSQPGLSSIDVLGHRITVALAALRQARAASNAQPSGYNANQELMAQVQLDQLLEQWPIRRRL